MGLDLDIAEDVEELFEHEITLQTLPVNAKDTRGGPKDTDYETTLEAVPCLIVPRDATIQERATQRQTVRYATVFTTTRMKLGATTRLRYDDPVSGVRYLYPKGEVNIAEIGQVWTIPTEEYP